MFQAVLRKVPRSQEATPESVSAAVASLVSGFSIETTPKQAMKIEDFRANLADGTRVFIAFIPGESTQRIAELAARLRDEGMIPVPHIPARSLADMAEFHGYVNALLEAGCDEALVLAGGLPQPTGDLTDSMQLLKSGVFETNGFKRLYVAGHPEGSPDIDAAGLAQALAFKNEYAARTGLQLTITTQFAFDGPGVMRWVDAIAASGNELPVHVGVAGPASVTNLLKYAKMCGVNASMGMLQKAGGKLFQLVGQSAPDGMICELATSEAATRARIAGVHVYPFGGFNANAGWFTSVTRGEFALHPRGSGFTV